MKVELFPFQNKAVNDLRARIAMALNSFKLSSVPQVVSLQAPTGSGKTIIMASLIEDIYYGTENFVEQPDAIFVWLSDSPALNEQSKQKIDLKADRIKFGQCVTIEDESFDMEMLEDGHIYFLNTQKLGKAGNLGRHSDTRQYTIWETLEKTAKVKSDRLYFIIDEAHRGMQGKAAGTATSIMQRFIKGSQPHKLSPMPVVIGMSATAARFNQLVGDTSSTLHKVIITPNEVRASGLLKERILITYPEDPEKHNDIAVLQAATDEWKKKCDHWHQYCVDQHYAHVNPVFVIQVLAGTEKNISNTNLDDVIAKIEERTNYRFQENEVVHTFGSTGTISINGLNVNHVDPSEITDDRRIKIVLFKENLSTGWDCPRAETMMSFRAAEDATYIAQLLGRMVRTPLQCHVNVDDYLNDVRLYLPYFNSATVKSVIDELQNTEGGDIPTVIDSESLEDVVYVPWTIHVKPHGRKDAQVQGQTSFKDFFPQNQSDSEESNGSQYPTESSHADELHEPAPYMQSREPLKQPYPQAEPLPIVSVPMMNNEDDNVPEEFYEQTTLPFLIDREEITKFINEQGLLTYVIRTAKRSSYLKSLLDLAVLLTQNDIYKEANDEVTNDVLNMIRNYVDGLKNSGQYDSLAAQVLQFKLLVDIYDVFGESIKNYPQNDLIATSDSDLDRQLRHADAKLGGFGFCNKYGYRYFNIDDQNAYKIDCILFAASDNCIAKLNKYAETKFNEYNDTYRRYIVKKSERCKKQYDDIVSNSDFVSKHNFSLPEELEAKVETGGKLYDNHLLADKDNGLAQIKLNSWEDGLIEEEALRPDFACWLRNPSKATWALRIPYEMDNEIKAMYPDFLIVRRDSVSKYVVDILEPHNPAFKDNLGKAKGLARYAEAEAQIGRVQLVRKEKNDAGKEAFKRLDMSKGAIRQKVLSAINNDELDHIFEALGTFAQ